MLSFRMVSSVWPFYICCSNCVAPHGFVFRMQYNFVVGWSVWVLEGMAYVCLVCATFQSVCVVHWRCWNATLTMAVLYREEHTCVTINGLDNKWAEKNIHVLLSSGRERSDRRSPIQRLSSGRERSDRRSPIQRLYECADQVLHQSHVP